MQPYLTIGICISSRLFILRVNDLSCSFDSIDFHAVK